MSSQRIIYRLHLKDWHVGFYLIEQHFLLFYILLEYSSSWQEVLEVRIMHILLRAIIIFIFLVIIKTNLLKHLVLIPLILLQPILILVIIVIKFHIWWQFNAVMSGTLAASGPYRLFPINNRLLIAINSLRTAIFIITALITDLTHKIFLSILHLLIFLMKKFWLLFLIKNFRKIKVMSLPKY